MDTQAEFAVARKSYYSQQYQANVKPMERKPKHCKLQPVDRFNWRESLEYNKEN